MCQLRKITQLRASVHISNRSITVECNTVGPDKVRSNNFYFTSIRYEPINLVRNSRPRSEILQNTISSRTRNNVTQRHREESVKAITDVESVKKIAPFFGWIFASFNELNWRPKKLSRRMVELYGG